MGDNNWVETHRTGQSAARGSWAEAEQLRKAMRDAQKEMISAVAQVSWTSPNGVIGAQSETLRVKEIEMSSDSEADRGPPNENAERQENRER